MSRWISSIHYKNKTSNYDLASTGRAHAVNKCTRSCISLTFTSGPHILRRAWLLRHVGLALFRNPDTRSQNAPPVCS